MKNRITLTIILAICLMVSGNAYAQTQEFTYQGSLADASVPQPTNGTYDFEFALFSASTGGTQIGSTLTRSNVSVVNGIFTVNLDFAGTSFNNGSPRFLEIRVFDSGSSSFVTLDPRQSVTAAPYSYRASIASFAQNAQSADFLTSPLAGEVQGSYNSTRVIHIGGRNAGAIVNAVGQVENATPEAIANTIVRRGASGDIRADKYYVGNNEILSRFALQIGPNSVNIIKLGDDADYVGVRRLLSGGFTSLCVLPGSTSVFSTCSSSLRYKKDIVPYISGLSFINQLEPISYAWKSGGLKDTGFGAEDVERIDKRFVTYNDKGQVEGVKYNRLSVVFVNAFKEQQAQIQNLGSENNALRTQLAELKKLVCLNNEKAEICKEAK